MMQFPHLQIDGVPESFKGPPRFKEVHIVELSPNNILTCSCGLKQRYGIPCRHLFFLEPEYNLCDIDHRYQITYSYYAFHPDHRDITRAYKIRHDKEHNGIQRKSLEIQETVPYLSHSSPYTTQYILDLHQSEVPICWNYAKGEYPNSFRFDTNANMELGDLTQESFVNVYDSDGVDDVVSQVEDTISVDSKTNDKPPSGIGKISLTDAQLLSKFKSVINCHKSQTSKTKLWNLLTEAEIEQKREILNEQPALVGRGPQEFVSLHLPLDKSRESVQYTYGRGHGKRKKRKR
jgi:hypothetical protein